MSAVDDERAVRRERRLRLAHVERELVDEFTCRARVVLEDPRGGTFEGRAELPRNQPNLLRVAAQATLAAMDGFLRGAVELRLVGLRTLRIFDTGVVAVHVASRIAEHERLLLGMAVAADDSAVGAARAVLHATNRLIGNFVDR